MDMQTLFTVIDRLDGMVRRAHTYGHNREDLIDEIAYTARYYRKMAERLEVQAEKDAANVY